ncbi:5-carboxymethyl-2-hydroxymuconate Delta-isomerase [Streptomyces genisteinicus]|uniref:Isomerase n=1 Tax=Streptomyces genisteinicus TaxID=2768068 RepID=A0A7H0HR28_9ACTN|nr:isomerase [Streptomyces genisteinicus]QNP62994.1 isomerase [Streptomyces genisteinicus]
MPQITVDCSPTARSALDRQKFALALHRLVVDTVGTRLEACKTRFRPADETVVGDGGSDAPLVHVGIALLPGRSEEVKARLSQAVVDLVAEHLAAAAGGASYVSAEIRDLEASYRKR